MVNHAQETQIARQKRANGATKGERSVCSLAAVTQLFYSRVTYHNDGLSKPPTNLLRCQNYYFISDTEACHLAGQWSDEGSCYCSIPPSSYVAANSVANFAAASNAVRAAQEVGLSVVASDTCEARMCYMYCENGFEMDMSTGCEICSCAVMDGTVDVTATREGMGSEAEDGSGMTVVASADGYNNQKVAAAAGDDDDHAG